MQYATANSITVCWETSFAGDGGKLDNFAPVPTFFKAQCRSDYHFCYVTVHGGRLCFKAFDHRGALFDNFDLEKR